MLDVPEGAHETPCDALGDVSEPKGDHNMTLPQFAFIKANWHADIVDRALDGFLSEIPAAQVTVYDVPGAFEMPMLAQKLALTGKYDAIACAALVVDGGIYRHDFVASAVVDGLMRVGLDTQVPVLSVSLTSHQFQETDHHNAIYRDHFVVKGEEAAQAALQTVQMHSTVAA